ncbi:DUF2243 domain-containing protein [Halobacteriales archaeon SW_10_66_29]|nr:MAG: DUF2243 domain-containing protein [Halobacteriales archaeon SW_10_66_29]
MRMQLDDHERILLGSGIFGFGLGAVGDVALFHHVLQWHHLLSARVDPSTLDGLRRNLLADGVFSLAMLGVMLAGTGIVWRNLNRTEATQPMVRLVGATLVGAGAFNLFDGVVDHYILNLHDVPPAARNPVRPSAAPLRAANRRRPTVRSCYRERASGDPPSTNRPA